MFRLLRTPTKAHKMLLKFMVLVAVLGLLGLFAFNSKLGAAETAATPSATATPAPPPIKKLPPKHSKKTAKAKKVVPAPPMSDEDVKTRERMVEWSRQLGVTCVYCHNVENFKSFEKKPMRTAQAHAEWVRLLNTQGAYKDAPKVDCYMCHRGVPIPDYKEKPLH